MLYVSLILPGISLSCMGESVPVVLSHSKTAVVSYHVHVLKKCILNIFITKTWQIVNKVDVFTYHILLFHNTQRWKHFIILTNKYNCYFFKLLIE